MATVIAYVDGFNLFHGLRAKYRRRYHWLDLCKLVSRLRPHDTVLSVRYFTAHVRNDPPGQARQQTYLSALAAHNGSKLDIVFGKYQAKTITCRQCGTGWTSYEEKETDVNIAVSLVADAASNAADIALIISADSDLCPAIRTARQLSNEFGMLAFFPPKRQSFEIKKLIPSALTLAQADVRNSLLPDTVTNPRTGRIYQRPATWT